MKRTPPWVFVAAVGVQLAALGLCMWAMERALSAADEGAAEPPAPAPEPSPVEALAPPPVTPQPQWAAEMQAAAAPEPRAEPVTRGSVTIRAVTATELAEEQRFAESRDEAPAPEPRIFAPEPNVRAYAPEPMFSESAARPGPAVVRVQATSPSAPLFGPPPVRSPQGPPETNGVPAFIGEPADGTTQIVGGEAADGRFAFGFYSDGNIRFVDVDGGQYAGKAESARARMREIEGMRAFTVQIGVAADGRLQATFSGGPHDGQTIALEPLAGGPTG